MLKTAKYYYSPRCQKSDYLTILTTKFQKGPECTKFRSLIEASGVLKSIEAQKKRKRVIIDGDMQIRICMAPENGRCQCGSVSVDAGESVFVERHGMFQNKSNPCANNLCENYALRDQLRVWRKKPEEETRESFTLDSYCADDDEYGPLVAISQNKDLVLLY